MHAFLIGGGREAAAVLAAHRPFIAALAGPGPVTCIVLDEGAETDPSRWAGSLRAAGADDVRVVVVSPERPPVAADLEGASGVYVAGGLTPGYQEVLAGDASWLAPSLPYAGFSAGAAVAARRAVVGGWRAVVDGVEVAVCDDGAGEDLDRVSVRDGLGVVDVLVDVHAAQWGTLGRLCHAVLAEGAPAEGWAIDEGTALECRDGRPVAVHGVGAAARATSNASGAVSVRFHSAGSSLPTAA
jgi:cyanophycinase